ncbi:hypothetical protein [Pseudonocardia benzenivorans]|uniref:hypothetical protein n=1 Tax=Pseudonocardia benzenivorans TaxID=228005 RepID=UPI0031F82BDE
MSLSRASMIDWWSESAWVDYAFTVAVVGSHLGVVIGLREVSIFSWPAESQRLAIYNSGATVVSIIVGITAVAIPVYLAAGGERAKAVRSQYADELRKNWRTVLSGMGLAAALCLLAQIVDRPNQPEPSWFIFEFAAVLAVTKFLRLMWLFNAIIRVADRDLGDIPRASAPELAKEWRRGAG